MRKDIECPYCGVGLNINHDDGYGYDEDKNYTATDYCMSVLNPSVGDFMGGAQ